MDNTFDNGTQYATNFWSTVVSGLPRLIGAVLILLIAYFVAYGVAAAARKVLEATKLNNLLHAGKTGSFVQRALPDPAEFLSKVVFWIIFLFGLSISVSFLGIPALVDLVHGIYAYLPNVLAAVLIFLVAGAVSAGISKFVVSTVGDTATGKVVSTAAPVLVMVIAVFMILNQLKIAPEIVTITYAAILGSAALAMALAFGLGGREVAGKMLGDLYIKGQQRKSTVTSDLKHGARNVKRDVKEL